MLHYSVSGGTDKSALAIVTVDSPRVILAVDPIAALLDFALAPFKNTVVVDDGDAEPEITDQQEPQPARTALAFRVEVVNATVVVLANDTDPKTQAIQLSIREIIMSQQVRCSLSDVSSQFPGYPCSEGRPIRHVVWAHGQAPRARQIFG